MNGYTHSTYKASCPLSISGECTVLRPSEIIFKHALIVDAEQFEMIRDEIIETIDITKAQRNVLGADRRLRPLVSTFEVDSPSHI